MQEKLCKISDEYNYYEIGDLGISVVKDNIPKKFTTTDIPKFKSTDNPIYHLKAFESTMAIKGVDKSLYPTVFRHSLEHIPQQWFYHLESNVTLNWENIVHAFIDRYRHNTRGRTSERELEILT